MVHWLGLWALSSPQVQFLVRNCKITQAAWCGRKTKTQSKKQTLFYLLSPQPLLGKEPLCSLGTRYMDQGGSSCLLLFPLLSLGHSGCSRELRDLGKASQSSLKFTEPEEVTLSGLSANWSFLKNTPVEREEFGNQEEQRQSKKTNENPEKTTLAEVSSALETTDQCALVCLN